MTRKASGETGKSLRKEAADHLKSLKTHGRVIEADCEDAELPPGVTHVLVTDKGSEKPRLVEKRKSFL